jgi:hypothetical protein
VYHSKELKQHVYKFCGRREGWGKTSGIGAEQRGHLIKDKVRVRKGLEQAGPWTVVYCKSI